jgi:hypothetical protein
MSSPLGFRPHNLARLRLPALYEPRLPDREAKLHFHFAKIKDVLKT